ncbi:MAG: sulfotransferase family 2 domain-containing protein [Pacificimonas sp.]
MKLPFQQRVRLASRRCLASLSNKRLLHFLHIGKTGGTAAKLALAELGSAPRHQLFLHGHRMTLADVPVGEGTLFFLRDPVSRFISGFNSRLRKGRPRTYVEWSAPEAAAFAIFKTPDDLASGLASTDAGRRADAMRAFEGIQHVRDRYDKWFGSPEYLLKRRNDIFFAGRQERLTDDVKRLFDCLNVPTDPRMPEDDVAAHRAPARMCTELSPRSETILKELLAADYRYLDLIDEWFGGHS